MPCLLLLGAMFSPARIVGAQSSDLSQAGVATGVAVPGADSVLDSLVAHALTASPAVRAALSRAEASRARIAPTSAWPDPMLMAGIQNVPLSRERGMPGGPDPMTMKMAGIAQRIPFPRKLSLQRRVAEGEAAASDAAFEATRRRIMRDVKIVYYELAFLDRALETAERNQAVLAGLIRLTEGRYGVGSAAQHDVLRARIEASRLAETAVTLAEQRRAGVARLNAILDQPSEAAITQIAVPARIMQAAVRDSMSDIRFVTAALGSRVADSPLPPLAELQELALRESAELREHLTLIAVQAARIDVARIDTRPDFDVALQYGQRTGYPDMVTATVSVPIPINRRRKQDRLVAGERLELSALESEYRARQNEIRADVARLASEVERARAQLALYTKLVLPQSRASLASATSGYEVGRVALLAVLDVQATLFEYEIEYFRALSDFAKAVAELEVVIGKEIVR